MATRYHQKAKEIITIGGHGLGGFIQPRALQGVVNLVRIRLLGSAHDVLVWAMRSFSLPVTRVTN